MPERTPRQAARDFRQAANRLQRLTNDTVDELGTDMMRTQKERVPVATGATRAAIHARREGRDYLRPGSLTRGRAQVRLMMPQHAQYVDQGRAAGKHPPPPAIRRWVKAKLKITKKKEVNRVAYLVGRKIARKGTKGARFIKPAWRELEQLANRAFDALGRKLRNILY
jgi:hypothetical protein